MANEMRVRGMLGFAMRAGKLVIGTEQALIAIKRRGAVRLVATASNASPGTKKKILTKCEFYGIETVQLNMTTDELGAIIGKTYSPACVAITDEGFAKEIKAASATVSN